MVIAPAQPPDSDDTSTIYTAVTPPESDCTDLNNDIDRSFNTQKHWPTPQPGRTFLIKDVTSDLVITLHGGRIVLSPPEGRESHWECIEWNGWLGFRNAVSGMFLGRDWGLVMCCQARWHMGWERFRVREKPERMGCVLLMDYWWSLRHIGRKVENGVEKLAVIENWDADEVVWEFVEV